jgi:coatomer protein complex subunit gamma
VAEIMAWLQEAVEAVMGILGMQPCEGTEAVPPNARSHTVLLSGDLVGHNQVGTLGH